MSAKGPESKKEGEARAEAFEREYKETHPDGPYPPVDQKGRRGAEP